MSIATIVHADVERVIDALTLPDWWELWPSQPWEFGEALARAAQALLPADYPLRNDRTFIYDFSRLLLRTAERLAKQELSPAVDCMVIEDGVLVAVGCVRPYRERKQKGAK